MRILLTLFTAAAAARYYDGPELNVMDTLPVKSDIVSCDGDRMNCPVYAKKGDDDQIVYDKVKFTLENADKTQKTITIGLFSKVYPYTTRSFLENAAAGNYNKSPMHRIIPQFMAQGGDFEQGTGTGGRGFYARKFNDENAASGHKHINHEGPGYVSMANAGKNTNGSQFFITFLKTSWLDGNHRVFGKVMNSDLDTVRWLESYGTQSGKPKKKVTVVSTEVWKVDDNAQPLPSNQLW